MKQSATQATAWRIACALAAITCAILAAPHATHAQCQYEVTAIIQGPPCGFGGGHAPLVGRGMNSHGHIAGSWAQCDVTVDEAFYWTPETGLVTLPRPSGVFSAIATDINDDGTIIGRHLVTQHGNWLAFAYHPDEDQFTYLYPKSPLFGTSSLNAINNAGIAVGSRSIGKPGQSPNPSNAIIWNTNTGEVIDLGVGDGPNSGATDISESGGYIGGWTGSDWLAGQAVIWTKGQPQVIGPLPGTNYSIVNAVNESGLAVGSGRIQSPAAFHAFIWDGAFTMIDGADGWQNARGEAINDLGQAFIRFSNPNPHVAMLWQHGELHHLNALFVDGSPDVHLTGVTATNNYGQVLCTASTRAVLLTPANRPLTDLNADCRTDVHDLLMLLDAWGRVPRGSDSPADFNRDGVVDVSDLLILLANWTIPEGR